MKDLVINEPWFGSTLTNRAHIINSIGYRPDDIIFFNGCFNEVLEKTMLFVEGEVGPSSYIIVFDGDTYNFDGEPLGLKIEYEFVFREEKVYVLVTILAMVRLCCVGSDKYKVV